MKSRILPLIGTLLLWSVPVHAEQFSVLLFTKTAGWHHQSLAAAVPAMRELATKHHVSLTWTNDSGIFTDHGLGSFQVIVFLSTTGDVLDAEQQRSMERFIRGGKGFVGIHAAADTEYDWPWYGQLVGRYFQSHPPTQTAQLQVHQRGFPGLERLPDALWWTDEWYEFSAANSPSLNVLLTVNDNSYERQADPSIPDQIQGGTVIHPIAWWQEFDGGRSFYTALGHTHAAWSDPLFLEHVFGGIFWAATGKGMKTEAQE